MKTDSQIVTSSPLQVESAPRDLHGESSGRATALLSALPRVSALSALCRAAAACSTALTNALLSARPLWSAAGWGVPPTPVGPESACG